MARNTDTTKTADETKTDETIKAPDDLVTEGQKADPAVPGAHDKQGDAELITAPGELRAGETKVNVKTTGAFLVFDPYTLDCVGEAGGEMRLTDFVREKIEAGKLEEI